MRKTGSRLFNGNIPAVTVFIFCGVLSVSAAQGTCSSSLSTNLSLKESVD